MLNLLFVIFFLALSPLSATEGELEKGWFPVEKRSPSEPEGDEEDPSLWIVFAKKIGTETLLLRFPEEPACKIFNDGSCELSASQDGAIHRLKVEKKQAARNRTQDLLSLDGIENMVLHPETGELSYLYQGKWFGEQIVEAGELRYILQTEADHLEEEAHQTFVRSFQILESS